MGPRTTTFTMPGLDHPRAAIVITYTYWDSHHRADRLYMWDITWSGASQQYENLINENGRLHYQYQPIEIMEEI